MENKTET